MIGKRINILRVLKVDPNSKYRRYICKCDCGSTISLDIRQIKQGHCGCRAISHVAITKDALSSLYVNQRLSITRISEITGLHRNTISKYVSEYNLRQVKANNIRPMQRKVKKVTGPKPRKFIGHTFGRLTVLEYVDTNISKRRMLKCRCECGEEITVYESDLCSRQVESCGCSTDESEPNKDRKNNIMINIDGETKVLSEWARELNVDYNKAYRRYRSGYDGKEIFA